MHVSIQNVKNLLEEKGIKPSVQRLSVLKYVMESEGHPSVDMIYRDLLLTIPTLSKTTVYNTLRQLTEKGILVALTIDESKVQYDFPDHSHAHFMCIKCGFIKDIFLDISNLNTKKIDDLEILNTQIYLKGICKKCQ